MTYKNKPFCMHCEKIVLPEYVDSHKALNHRVEIYSFAPYKSQGKEVVSPAPKKEEKVKFDLADVEEEPEDFFEDGQE